MKIVFMGTPEFAVPSLEALVAAGHQVVGVFSQPDKPKNRGMKLQPTPVKLCAMVHDLPVYQPTKLRDGTALETIRSLAPDLIVVAASCPRRSWTTPSMAASTSTPPCCPSTAGLPPSTGPS